MSGALFDPTHYYRLSNVVNFTLALGIDDTEPPPPLTINPIRSSSSENWQLFYDDGVYFIRNWEYGSRYQLGVEAGDLSTPLMMKTGSGLGMQWNITMAAGDDRGRWILKNFLVGPANVLGMDSTAKSKVPVMNTDPMGGKWSININKSAQNATDAMVLPFPSIEGSAEPSTSISASSPAARLSESLGGGAIAGIVVGCVAAALIILAALFFFWRSRRRDVPASHEPKDENAGQHESQTLPELQSNFTARAELDATHQASELPVYRQG